MAAPGADVKGVVGTALRTVLRPQDTGQQLATEAFLFLDTGDILYSLAHLPPQVDSTSRPSTQ